MRAREFLLEGDVIKNKFSLKQQQKGKDKYEYDTVIANDIPMYDTVNHRGVLPKHLKNYSMPETVVPFDHFEAIETSANAAHIYGVTDSGDYVRLSTAHATLAKALVDAYNRGGFVDRDLTKFDEEINESMSGLPWTLKSAGDGDFYIQRKGNNAGTPHRERRSTSDYAVIVDQTVLLPDYLYYVVQAAQSQGAFKPYITGSVIPGINRDNINQVLINFFHRAKK